MRFTQMIEKVAIEKIAERIDGYMQKKGSTALIRGMKSITSTPQQHQKALGQIKGSWQKKYTNLSNIANERADNGRTTLEARRADPKNEAARLKISKNVPRKRQNMIDVNKYETPMRKQYNKIEDYPSYLKVLGGKYTPAQLNKRLSTSMYNMHRDAGPEILSRYNPREADSWVMGRDEALKSGKGLLGRLLQGKMSYKEFHNLPRNR